jgi:hypothetical protein
MPRCKLSLRNPVYGDSRNPEELGVLGGTPQRKGMRGAVATNKEQLLARPRESERAG